MLRPPQETKTKELNGLSAPFEVPPSSKGDGAKANPYLVSPPNHYVTALQDFHNRHKRLFDAGVFWRNTSIVLVVVILGLSFAIKGLMERRTEVPYLIALDDMGAVYPVGPANPVPEERFIRYYLTDFIRKVRSVSIDTFAMERSLAEGYAYIQPQSAARQVLETYHRDERKPFETAQKVSIATENITFIRVSDHTFRGQWSEVARTHLGEEVEKRHYWGEFSVRLFPPKTREGFLKNPLGLQIFNFSWSETEV